MVRPDGGEIHPDGTAGARTLPALLRTVRRRSPDAGDLPARTGGGTGGGGESGGDSPGDARRRRNRRAVARLVRRPFEKTDGPKRGAAVRSSLVSGAGLLLPARFAGGCWAQS